MPRKKRCTAHRYGLFRSQDEARDVTFVSLECQSCGRAIDTIGFSNSLLASKGTELANMYVQGAVDLMVSRALTPAQRDAMVGMPIKRRSK